MKRPLRELRRGDVFRTADGLLWRVAQVAGAVGVGRWSHAVGRESESVYCPPGTLVEPLDLPALLTRLCDLESENRDLRGMVADLWDESRAARLGAEAERGAVLEALAALLPASVTHDQTAVAARVVGLAIDAVKARGPWRPPVPPCRLEGAVREAAAVLEALWPVLVNRDLGHSAGEVERALARLRAALGED